MQLKLYNVMMVRTALKAVLLRDTVGEIPKADVLLFSHDVDNSETLNGKAYGRLLDTIQEDFVGRGLAIAHVSVPYSVLSEEQTYFKRYRMNRARFAADLAQKTNLFRFQKNRLERVFRRILLRSGAKFIFAIDLPVPLARAASQLGVTSIEVLHGKGYLSNDPVPINWANRSEQELPSVFLALDEVSHHTFSQIGFKYASVLQVTDFWLDRFSNQQRGRLPLDWRAPPSLSRERKHVVVVSMQWKYSVGAGDFEGILQNGYLPNSVLRAIENSEPDVRWLLRIHPVLRRSGKGREAESFLESLSRRQKNVEWKLSSTVPLPAVLSVATRHVTMRSGATIEASQMGVPTALLCPTTAPGGLKQELFHDLREKGVVRRFHHEDDESLLDWVRSPLLSERRPSTKEAISLKSALEIIERIRLESIMI